MNNAILIASNNTHKLREFEEIFTQFGAGDIQPITPAMLGLAVDPEESGETYLANARIKARTFHDLIRAANAGNRVGDLWVMADDSGLEVDSLSGGPGVRSARYHQTAPNKDGCGALLQALTGVPEAQRTARFRAVIVLVESNGTEHVFEGVCEGAIGFDQRGSGGFGFDPVFRVAGGTRHMAELPSEEKHRVSHRGLAAQQMIRFLRGGTA